MDLKFRLIKAVRKIAPFAFLDPEGDRGIARIGHRQYVGGNWEAIGALQFNFLVAQGMAPDSYLLDIACGALRLGVHAIPYLEPGHYLGIEKERGLVEAGLAKELGAALQAARQPRIVVSDAFEFERFERRADFAIAQSLFTHLPPALIGLCFDKLLPCLADNGVFYATYFEVPVPRHNPDTPHDHGYFAYTRQQMLDFGEGRGFQARYIGEWNHPGEQVIVEYRPAR